MTHVWASNPSINHRIGNEVIDSADRLTEILETGEGNWLSNHAGETVVYKEYWLGRTYYCHGFFDAAIPHFRKATKAPVPDVHSNDDTDRRDRLLIGRSWGHLGFIYSASSYFNRENISARTDIPLQNDWKSIQCYMEEAMNFNYPGSMYIYGKALVYGTGAVPRNITEGLKYLNKAGAEKIGEAYLELGSIYERGVGQGRGGVEKDIAMARDYYNEAFRVYNFAENRRTDGWIPEIWMVHNLLFSEAWHQSESLISEIMGQRFNWNVAGQAFLFSAAAQFGFGDAAINKDSAMNFCIPILGIILAFFLLAIISEAIFRIGYERKHIDLMNKAKNAAFKAIVDALEQSEITPHPFKSAVSTERKRYWKFKCWCYFRQFLNNSIVMLAYSVSLAFVASWLALMATDNLITF